MAATASLLSLLVVPVLLLLVLGMVLSCSAFQHQLNNYVSNCCNRHHHHQYIHQNQQSSSSSSRRSSSPRVLSTTTTTATTMLRVHHTQQDDDNSCSSDDVVVMTTQKQADNIDRRQMLTRSSLSLMVAVAGAAMGTTTTAAAVTADGDDGGGDAKLVRTDPDTGKPIYKTSSGLEYIDLSSKKLRSSTTAAAVSPRYGQLVGFSYVGYLSLPKNDNKLQKFATQSSTYITKHGNGKLVAGLDEGLHTMKVGQTRRIIIPPKLGFVTSGLGPLPEQPWQRWKLNSLLDQMIVQQGGRLVYDVTLELVFDDEADQGYYEGTSSQERTKKTKKLFTTCCVIDVVVVAAAAAADDHHSLLSLLLFFFPCSFFFFFFNLCMGHLSILNDGFCIIIIIDEEITPEERAELEARLQNSQRSRGGSRVGASSSESTSGEGE